MSPLPCTALEQFALLFDTGDRIQELRGLATRMRDTLFSTCRIGLFTPEQVVRP